MKYRRIVIVAVLTFFTAGICAAAVYPYHRNRQFCLRLAGCVNRHIVVSHANCAVLIKDLSRPDVEYSYGRYKRFAAASMIKVHILAAVMRACAEGRIGFDSRIMLTCRDVTGGSGKIKCMRLPAEFTLAQLLKLMITQSDNTASNKVISLLGFDYINETCRQLGANDTVLCRPMMDFSRRRQGVDNYTTVNDVALVLEKIYNGALYGAEASRFALSLLKEQAVNDRIPKLLPANTVVAHKTGLERNVVHDAGIVFSPRGDYIICVFTKGVRDYRKGKNFIAQISRLVYNLYS